MTTHQHVQMSSYDFRQFNSVSSLHVHTQSHTHTVTVGYLRTHRNTLSDCIVDRHFVQSSSPKDALFRRDNRYALCNRWIINQFVFLALSGSISAFAK